MTLLTGGLKTRRNEVASLSALRSASRHKASDAQAAPFRKRLDAISTDKDGREPAVEEMSAQMDEALTPFRKK